MQTSLYLAASGMVSQFHKLDVLVNNLANVETSGFKGDVVGLEGVRRTKGGWSPPMVVSRPAADLRPGPLRRTDNPLDLALDGEGFFVVDTPQGLRYTRAGNFSRDGEGYLITQAGYRVMGREGPLRLPDREFTVDSEGRILQGGNEVGAFQVVQPERPEDLVKESGTLFALREGAAEPGEAEAFEVRQGFLEASNVNGVETLSRMLATLRACEAYQKVIQALDQTMDRAINELGKV